MDLDKKLTDSQYSYKENWGKMISIAKRQFDEWAMQKLTGHGYADFKMAYMPVLMNISAEGTSNNELASHARVTKQAMSKVAKALQASGYIRAKTSADDKRSTIFSLTDRGKKLVIEARLSVKELMDDYRRQIGKEDFDNAMKVIQKILDYTDQKLADSK